MADGGREHAVLWTVRELEQLSQGKWLRKPGADWNPRYVRRGPKHPGWLSDAVIFVRSIGQLQTIAKLEPELKSAPAGCIVVPNSLSTSKYCPAQIPILVADSHPEAIMALAKVARERNHGDFVVVTGTVGKTTTRTMLTHILEKHGATGTNVTNTYVLQHVASTHSNLRYSVFEIGLGQGKESFSDLGLLICPNVVVLTQLGLAHLDAVHAPSDGQALTTDEGLKLVLQHKLQLLEGLEPSGTFIANAEIPFFDEIVSNLPLGNKRMISFGDHPRSEARLIEILSKGKGSLVTAKVRGRELQYFIPLPGRFMATNSLAALLAAETLGIDVSEAAASLSDFKPIGGRAIVKNLTIGGKRFTLIDDSYNATPLSVRASFQLLQDLAPTGMGRKIAVLGDIAHLEGLSSSLHAGLARDAVVAGVDRIYTYGSEMLHLQCALPENVAAGHFTTKCELVERLISDLRPGDVIAVKASMPSKMGTLVRMVRNLADALPRSTADSRV